MASETGSLEASQENLPSTFLKSLAAVHQVELPCFLAASCRRSRRSRSPRESTRVPPVASHSARARHREQPPEQVGRKATQAPESRSSVAAGQPTRTLVLQEGGPDTAPSTRAPPASTRDHREQLRLGNQVNPAHEMEERHRSWWRG